MHINKEVRVLIITFLLHVSALIASYLERIYVQFFWRIKDLIYKKNARNVKLLDEY